MSAFPDYDPADSLALETSEELLAEPLAPSSCDARADLGAQSTPLPQVISRNKVHNKEDQEEPVHVPVAETEYHDIATPLETGED